MTKQCSVCHEHKSSPESFYSPRTRKCKVCTRRQNGEHYQRKRAAYLATKPAYVMPSKKACTKCGEVKPVSEFYLRTNRSVTKPDSHCKACRRATSRRYHKANRDEVLEYTRDYWLRTNYGISTADYNALFEAQGGVCKLCSEPQLEKRLSVDHCHDTGRVRGLLCTRCNSALGTLGDTEEALRRVLAYVTNPK